MRTLAVLASGQGTNFEALAVASRRGELGGTIAVLLCDREDAPALDRARALGIDAVTLAPGRFHTRLEDERPWVDALRARDVHVVVLAGFMRRLHANFLGAFPDRVLNIHPSLLPDFAGLDAIRRAWEARVPVTGCTVHLVTAELDAGPIVAQREVALEEQESLAELEARVHEAEHALYPPTVRRFLTEAWRRDGGRIVFDADLARARGAHA
jgi:phosphoribosylglycinamide formyltransferase-1